MVALLLTAAGGRILYLGTEVPPAQVAGLVKDLDVRAGDVTGWRGWSSGTATQSHSHSGP
jgi:methanogenic corrinoid protein MtbC1